MKIYTKKGDTGQTSLFDKRRVYKDDLRIEAIGQIDELGSYLGLCKHFVNEETKDELELIQNKLFVVTTNLATEHKENIQHFLKEEDISTQEEMIDSYLGMVPKVTEFILPGTSIASAHLHVARTLARKAERTIITLNKKEEIDPLIIKYVNRLSDTLFAIARFYEEDVQIVSY